MNRTITLSPTIYKTKALKKYIYIKTYSTNRIESDKPHHISTRKCDAMQCIYYAFNIQH